MGLFSRKKEKTAREWFVLAYNEKDPKKTVEYYTKCLEIDPKDGVAWNNKGFALDDSGRYEEAIRCYDKALEIDPEDATAKSSKEIAEEKLREQEQKGKEALNAINDAHSALQKAKKLGINTNSEEEKLNNAKLSSMKKISQMQPNLQMNVKIV